MQSNYRIMHESTAVLLLTKKSFFIEHDLQKKKKIKIPLTIDNRRFLNIFQFGYHRILDFAKSRISFNQPCYFCKSKFRFAFDNKLVKHFLTFDTILSYHQRIIWIHNCRQILPENNRWSLSVSAKLFANNFSVKVSISTTFYARLFCQYFGAKKLLSRT